MNVRSSFAIITLFAALAAAPLVAAAHPRHAAKHTHRSDSTPREARADRIAKKHHRETQVAQAEFRHHEHHHASQAQPVHLTRAERRHAARLAALEAQHQAKIVKARIVKSRIATARRHHPVPSALTHNARLAQHYARLAQHYAKLAKIQAKQQEHLAHLRTQHATAIAAHDARLAKIAAKIHAHREALARSMQPHAIRDWETSAYDVPIKVITVDLNDPTIQVSGLLARNGIGSAEPFTQMIRRNQPDVAVTGTFFSLDNLHPVGDIVLNGGLAYFGGMGTALCITPDNRADMITVSWGHHHDWNGYDFVMACGPRLLESGRVVLDPHAEHFKDRHMLSPNSRIGVGITRGNKLVFVMTKKRIYLGRLAKVMRAIGCSEAMNLDAGTSTGFYCNGRLMARPGRWLTNAIVVHQHTHVTQRASLM